MTRYKKEGAAPYDAKIIWGRLLPYENKERLP